MAEENFLKIVSDNRQFWIKMFAPILLLYFIMTFIIVEGAFGIEVDCKRDIGLWIEALERQPQNHREAISNIQSKAEECRIDLEKDFQFSFKKLMELKKTGAIINLKSYIQRLKDDPPDDEKSLIIGMLAEEMKISGLKLSDLFEEASLDQVYFSIRRALKNHEFLNRQEQIEFYKLVF